MEQMEIFWQSKKYHFLPLLMYSNGNFTHILYQTKHFSSGKTEIFQDHFLTTIFLLRFRNTLHKRHLVSLVYIDKNGGTILKFDSSKACLLKHSFIDQFKQSESKVRVSNLQMIIKITVSFKQKTENLSLN